MIELEAAVSLVDDAAAAVTAERDLLVVTGTEAASYLQGQLSQDVEGLPIGGTARTLLLQPQGKVDAWLRVHRRAPEEFWLDTDAGHGSGAAARLERFKLRVDVAIEVREVTVLAVRGPDAPGMAGPALERGLVALDASWGGVAGVDVLDPAGDLDPVATATALGLPLGPPELAELVRVRQGLPAMGRELDGSTIPAAAGIVGPSVDFTKGCYVGQELVARIDSRGNNTPTRLHALRFDGPQPPPAGAELLLGGEVVGSVTSAVAAPGSDAVGLGYLKRSVETPATLAVGSDPSLRAEASAVPGPG